MLKKIIPIAVAVVLVVAIGAYWYYRSGHPSTDDAYVKAHVVHIAPQVSGRIEQVYIKNHQTVKQGELLFTIDPRPFQIALHQAKAKLAIEQQAERSDQDAITIAEAQVKERQAQLVLAEKNAKRTLALVAKGEVARSEGDQVQSALDVAKANLKAAKQSLQQARDQLGQSGHLNAQIQQAQAVVDQSALDLQHTKVYAPAAGVLDQVSLRPGDTVAALQSQFALIEANEWWVDANFKETDIGKIRPGQAATIEIDMYPGVHFHGKVASISFGSGASFSLLPPENATGNWVKVTQRFPVKVLFNSSEVKKRPLRVGSSATVTVKVDS